MKKLIPVTLCIAIVVTILVPTESMAQRRRVVVRPRAPHVVVRPRAPHTRLVVRRGHPVVRRLPATVVVRPARTAVVVGAPPVFLPSLAWTAAVVSMPPRERLVWEDSEVIEREEDWVDANF